MPEQEGNRKFSRKAIFAVALSCLVIFVGLFMACGQREPVYQGKKLSSWLEAYNKALSPPLNTSQMHEAAEAVQNIGTNALPFLVRWISYNPPVWRQRALGLLRRLSPRFKPLLDGVFPDAADRSGLALLGFQILNAQASGTAPDLERLINDSKSSYLATIALGYIGKAGLPPLMSALVKPGQSNRAGVLRAIGALGANAAPAVPQIVHLLNDRDVFVATTAATVLGDLGLEPDLAVPALARIFQNTNSQVRVQAALSLGKFGDKARPAVPALKSGVTDREPVVRAVALNMLMEIAPEGSKSVGRAQ